MVTKRLPAAVLADTLTEARGGVPRLMSELRARAIAAVCPLTTVQVLNLSYFAALEDGRPEFELWLYWSAAAHEVGEWLWQYWQENASDPEEDGPGLDPLSRLNYQQSPAPAEKASAGAATASDAGQRLTRGIPEVAAWSWSAGPR